MGTNEEFVSAKHETKGELVQFALDERTQSCMVLLAPDPPTKRRRKRARGVPPLGAARRRPARLRYQHEEGGLFTGNPFSVQALREHAA